MAINFLHNLDLSKNELQNASMHPLTANPASPVTGQFYFNTASDVIRIYNGTAWVEFSSVSLATDTQQGTVKLFSNTDQTIAANTVTTTAGRTYGVQLNGSDQMVVNVPWTNTTYTAGVGLRLVGTQFKADLIDETLRSVTAEAITVTADRTYAVMPDADGDLVVNVPWTDTTGAVTSVDEVTPGTSSGTPIVVNPTVGDVKVQSMAYAGTTNVGHVPSGGSATTFLRGDGTWVTPTDTNTNQLTTFQVEDGDGNEVTISHAKEWKFVEGPTTGGASIDINWTDLSPGSDTDPYDLTFTVTNTDRGSSQNIFKTMSVTDTDSGFTWAGTGSVVADNNSDTVTFVSGSDIDIDVDAASDAIRISHGDTSSLNGVQGSNGIASITVDDNGHVTAVSTTTYNNTTYNFNLAAASGNATVLTLDASAGDDDTVTFEGTANEIEITTPATGDAGTVKIGLPTNVVIAGDLTVNGSTTTVSTNNLLVEDALIGLQAELTGANSNDIGFIFERGSTGPNGVFIWDRSRSEFALGTTTATPASTGDLTYTVGSLYADLTGNADTATALANSRNFSISGGGITAGTVPFNGTGDVVLNASIDNNAVTNTKLADMAQSRIKGRASGAGTGDPTDLTAAQVRTIINVADGADNYGGWNLQVNSSNTTGGASVGSAETVDFLSTTTEHGGITITNPAANDLEFNVIQGTTSLRGALQLANAAETITGTNTSKVVTPDTLAATKVTSVITIASLTGSGRAAINHALGTEDISVELYDQDGKTVYAVVERGDLSGASTTNWVTIEFNQVPAGITTVDAVIHSHRGATPITAQYSA